MMIIENWALWLARSFASSPRGDYNIEGLQFSKYNGSQICWCFSVSEIDQFKENVVPQKTKDATNLESSYSKVGW